ncbi:TatD family hydrolase [Candidatus Giovannonibacteria bacterium]|nr:TatD family hydrolase [Candidatus Giovannonibacteria bacterium]
MPKLIDVHTHVHFAAYDTDRDMVIKRALEKGIWLINVGTQKNTSQNAVELAHKYEGVWASIGLHPIHTEKSYHDSKELGSSSAGNEANGFISREESFDYDFYKKLATDPKVVAIGECGLDYYRLTEETKHRQAEVFVKQIELSSDIKKPLMIHCREAFHDLVDILNANRSRLNTGNPGVIHFFSGTLDDAAHLMDMGFSFSFGGVVTFARAYEKLVKGLPLERIVLETDAPYVTPQSHRGERNESLFVEEVAQKISRIMDKDFEEVAAQTTENAVKIFGLK